ncbi:MAG TPA: serine hydrolase domain-containing protein [Gemmatimonadaceae bacterium]
MTSLRALVLAVVLIPSLAGAQALTPAERARHAADSAAAALIADSVAGVVIGVFRGTTREFTSAYGYADVAARRRMTADAEMPIASITKQFVAAGVLALVDEGRVNLDDQIAKHLPPMSAHGNVTVRQLLHQTSGIGRYESAIQTRLLSSTDDVVQVIAEAPVEFQPGERFSYNNANYLLLGALIERVTGQRWDEYLGARFFARVGMAHTRGCPDGAEPGSVVGYMSAGGPRVRRARLPLVLTGASGGLCSTAADLARWSVALHGGELLSPAGTAAMITPLPLPAQAGAGAYAMGTVVSMLDGHRELWHNGALSSGFHSMLAYYPDDSLTVVVLTNTFPKRPEPAARAVARAWFGVQPVAAPAVASHAAAAQSPLPLAAYAGVYSVGPLRFTVSVANDALTLVDPNGSSMALQSAGVHTFASVRDSTFKVLFDVTDGRVTQLRIDSPRAKAPPVPRVADTP